MANVQPDGLTGKINMNGCIAGFSANEHRFLYIQRGFSVVTQSK